MNPLESLRKDIANALSQEKAYTLASVCVEVGLSAGEDSEAWRSKYYYVHRRLSTLGSTALIDMGKRVLERYPSYQLEETLDLLTSSAEGVISAITRRNIIDELCSMGNLAGKLHLPEFLNRIFPLAQMPGPDSGFSRRNLEECVYQHMVRNEDWSYQEFFEFAQFIQLSERRFRLILEQVVHPEVRTGADQESFVTALNRHLLKDGFELLAVDQTSGYLVYRIVKKGGVVGLCKNLIFAATGPKPRLVLADAIKCLRSELGDHLPAIIPQVYLHYDPFTLRELPNGSALVRQRMDFLLLFPFRQRIVIEIDGQQHYSVQGKPDPRRYAEMVAEDRNLRLQGYEVYRFGGHELSSGTAKHQVESFLARLIKKLS